MDNVVHPWVPHFGSPYPFVQVSREVYRRTLSELQRRFVFALDPKMEVSPTKTWDSYTWFRLQNKGFGIQSSSSTKCKGSVVPQYVFSLGVRQTSLLSGCSKHSSSCDVWRGHTTTTTAKVLLWRLVTQYLQLSMVIESPDIAKSQNHKLQYSLKPGNKMGLESFTILVQLNLSLIPQKNVQYCKDQHQCIGHKVGTFQHISTFF